MTRLFLGKIVVRIFIRSRERKKKEKRFLKRRNNDENRKKVLHLRYYHTSLDR